MRFLHIPVRPEAVEAYTSFYDFRVGPLLKNVPGCLFARLIQDTASESGLLSFTVWSSPEAAEEYEQSDLNKQFAEEHTPFTEDTTEFKIQLSEDLKLELKAVQDEPAVQGMPVVAGMTDGDPAEQIGDYTFIRTLSAKTRPGKLSELRMVYDEEITPALLAVDGCRGAYLIALNDENDVLSVSIWESKRHADAYENSGVFDRLFDLARPYLSSLMQWKMSLDPEMRSETLTSEDQSIKGYRIITGEKA